MRFRFCQIIKFFTALVHPVHQFRSPPRDNASTHFSTIALHPKKLVTVIYQPAMVNSWQTLEYDSTLQSMLKTTQQLICCDFTLWPIKRQQSNITRWTYHKQKSTIALIFSLLPLLLTISRPFIIGQSIQIWLAVQTKSWWTWPVLLRIPSLAVVYHHRLYIGITVSTI